MKKVLVAAVVGLGFLTAACGGTSEQPTAVKTVTAAPQPSESSTPSSDPQTQRLPDSQFGALVRDNTVYFDSWSDADLAKLAVATCQGFDQGRTFLQQANVIYKHGASPHDSGYFVGAAIGNYCPQHEDLLNDNSGANS
jgi:hypothetical protein